MIESEFEMNLVYEHFNFYLELQIDQIKYEKKLRMGRVKRNLGLKLKCTQFITYHPILNTFCYTSK